MDDGRLRTLQLFYAALMVDSALRFEGLGASQAVAAAKAREQEAAAPGQLAQLGIGSGPQLFTQFAELFGCAAWKVEAEEGGATRAETSTCLACAIAKRRGGGRPCELYCINPFKGLAAALPEKARLEVEETLWEGSKCLFRLSPA